MRHPQLHAALRTAADHGGRALAAWVEDGDEVPFELIEHAAGSRRTVDGTPPTLYSYRPLVGLYVERHAEDLARLPAVAEAAHALVASWGLEAYLEARGVSRPPADPHDRAALAVRQFLERTFEEAPDFVLRDDQFARAFAELEAVLTVDATETVVAIPLVGVEVEMATVAITRGVALQRPDALRGAVPAAALAGPDGEDADAVATLRWAARPGSSETPRRAREAARRLVTALRLHCAGAAPAAGPLVWLRAAGGPWRAMALGGTFTSRGHASIGVDDVPDLQAFVELVARRLPDRGEVAWALRRWTLALDRDRPEEALSDLLLAGRALLEPEGPRSGRLAGRLAALVAPDGERAALTRRLAALAVAEQDVVAGRPRRGDDLPERIDELADCLRAVLRDCVCGHLSGDLVEVAEDVLDRAVVAGGEERHRFPARGGDLRERVLAAVRPLVARPAGRPPLAGRHLAPLGATPAGDVADEEPVEVVEERDPRDVVTQDDEPITATDEPITVGDEATLTEEDLPRAVTAAGEEAVAAPVVDPLADPDAEITVVDRRGLVDADGEAPDGGPSRADAAGERPGHDLFGPAVDWVSSGELDGDDHRDDDAIDERWLAEVDRDRLWLDQTWDDRDLEETTGDEPHGPWPVSRP